MDKFSPLSLDRIRHSLEAGFSGSVDIRVVPAGYAISTNLTDRSGDPIVFYLVKGDQGFRIEDDGSYLAQLVARDIPFDQGTRGQRLEAILQQGFAFWDRDTFEIKTSDIAERELPKRVVAFPSSLIRIRDLALLPRDVARSTFTEDALSDH